MPYGRAIRDSSLDYFPSAHIEEHDPDDASAAVFRMYPASLLPFRGHVGHSHARLRRGAPITALRPDRALGRLPEQE